MWRATLLAAESTRLSAVNDVAARHTDARMTEQRFDGQLAQAQFVRRAGIGMTKAVRGVVVPTIRRHALGNTEA